MIVTRQVNKFIFNIVHYNLWRDMESAHVFNANNGHFEWKKFNISIHYYWLIIDLVNISVLAVSVQSQWSMPHGLWMMLPLRNIYSLEVCELECYKAQLLYDPMHYQTNSHLTTDFEFDFLHVGLYVSLTLRFKRSYFQLPPTTVGPLIALP